MEEEWKVLHDWATNFRKEHKITTTQFLEYFNLPSSDAAKLYLYPRRRNVLICMDIQLEHDLFKGLQEVMKSEGPYFFDKPKFMDVLKERYQMNRDKLEGELGVISCFFDEENNITQCIARIRKEDVDQEMIRTILELPKEWKIIVEDSF